LHNPNTGVWNKINSIPSEKGIISLLVDGIDKQLPYARHDGVEKNGGILPSILKCGTKHKYGWKRTTRNSINSTLCRRLAPVRTFWLTEIYPITAGIPTPGSPDRSLGTADYAMPAGFSLYGAKTV
jgi:hypothetical protein